MVSIDVSIEANNIDSFKDALDEAIDKALEEIGLQVENFATLLCPADTGLLKNSITYAVHGSSPAKGEYVADNPSKNGELKSGSYSGSAPDEEGTVYIGSNVEYAAYVEMGTSKMSPRPYLEPAVTNHISDYEKIVKECLQNA